MEVIKSGLLDTLQDAGRFGLGHLGVNPNGPMDEYAAQLANALVGNHLHEVVLEMHFPAAATRFHHAALIAMTGADFDARHFDGAVRDEAARARRGELVAALAAEDAGAFGDFQSHNADQAADYNDEKADFEFRSAQSRCHSRCSTLA